MIRTLIVDDDPAVRRLHGMYLQDIEGFTLVGAVGSGEAAARLAASTDVDLVLLDMRLPDFSGIEVLHRIREERGAAVDVFVISSARDRVTVRQALSARIVGYLVKPFTEEAFVERLSAYRLARQQAQPDETEVALGQGEIDGLVLGRPVTEPLRVVRGTGLPKGLSVATMDRVVAALSTTQAVTAADIAESTGVARVTVRRYLDHLVREGEVDVAHRYGRRGRPELLYRRVTSGA